ncbi:MAG: putative quinol monooxygenase, partial [Plesiomonas sp.]
DMITLNVFFTVKPEKKTDFLALLNTMVTESNKEDGCTFYQLWNNAAQENQYALIEYWDNKEVLAAHQKTPHWIAFNDIVNSYLVQNYQEHHYSEIAR